MTKSELEMEKRTIGALLFENKLKFINSRVTTLAEAEKDFNVKKDFNVCSLTGKHLVNEPVVGVTLLFKGANPFIGHEKVHKIFSKLIYHNYVGSLSKTKNNDGYFESRYYFCV